MSPEPVTPDPLLARATEFVTATGQGDVDNVTASLAEARALVKNWVGEPTNLVPEEVMARAILEVTADLFYRKMARNGVMEFGGTDLAPFRIRADPMKAGLPLLRPFLPGGIA